jgi:hypothetical protein
VLLVTFYYWSVCLEGSCGWSPTCFLCTLAVLAMYHLCFFSRR